MYIQRPGKILSYSISKANQRRPTKSIYLPLNWESITKGAHTRINFHNIWQVDTPRERIDLARVGTKTLTHTYPSVRYL